MSTTPAIPSLNGGSANSAAPKGQLNLVAKLHRYRLLLGRRWWILFLTISTSVSFQALNTVSTPPKYTSSGRMMVTGHIALPGTAAYVEEANNFYGTQVELMQSQAVRLAAEARIQTLHPELKQVPVTVSVGQQAKTAIFIFQATGDQPEYTQALLDATMQSYIEAKKEMRTNKTDLTLSAITEELKVLERDIKAGDESLVEFQKQYNVNFLKDETNSAGSYLSGLDSQLNALTTDYQLLTRLSLDQNIDRQRGKAPSGAQGGASGSAPDDRITPGFGAGLDYTSTKQEIQLLKAKRDDFAQTLRPKHPIIVKFDQDISLKEKLLAMLRDESKAQIDDKRKSVEIQIKNLQEEREKWSKKALELSARTAQFEALKAKVDRSKSLYEHLLTSMQAIDVTKGVDQDVISIIENASSPNPMKPGMAKAISVAVVGGLIIGLGILFLLDILDDRLISISEFESQFGERILGRIPHEGLEHSALLTADDERHIFGESFSNLRSSVLYLPYDAGRPKTILITSAVPNEGKSTISSNFAATLAFGGAKTLLVDGDLRRGSAHEVFNVEGGPGFAEILTEGKPWRELVQKSNVENLSVIRCGKRLSQPSKNLLGSVLEDFLKQVHSEYDFVVFDSCPVLAADDTTTLAPKLDAVIFVVRLGFTRRTTVRNAMTLLYERQVNLLGAVLNDVNPAVDGYHYYSYSDYYGAPVKA